MRKLKFLLDRNSLQIIYFSFIRPLLKYADIVQDNYTYDEANELEKIQIEAARIVTGAARLISLYLLYTETGWDTLACRGQKYKITMFYKMYLGLSHAYLSSFCHAQLEQMFLSTYANQNSIKKFKAVLSSTINGFFRVL